MFKFSKAMKNKKDGDKPKILNSAERNFKEKMMLFKNKIIEMRKFDTTVEYTYLSKNLLAFGEYINTYKENQDKTEEQQEKMLEFLKSLLTSKGVDFDQFISRIDEDEEEKERAQEEQETNIDPYEDKKVL